MSHTLICHGPVTITSNMSKLDDSGRPVVDPGGKVLKGPNFRPPDLAGALFDVPVSN